MYYLKELNYEVKFDDVMLNKEEKEEIEKLECDTDLPYDDIKPISNENELTELINRGNNNNSSEYDKARVNKELMLIRFYHGGNSKKDIDTKNLKKIWDFWRKGAEKPKLKRLQDELNGDLEVEFKEALNSDKSRLNKIFCYDEIKKMYEVLGIRHSADDEKHFKNEDFQAMKEELQPLITKLFKKLSIRDKNKNSEFKQGEGVKLKNDINRILKQWTGSSCKKCDSKMKRKNGKKIHDTKFNLQNMVGVDKDILKNKYPPKILDIWLDWMKKYTLKFNLC
jgi:hypothetical protein